jgi:uncharacterized membrane protein
MEHHVPQWALGMNPVLAIALISIMPAFELSGSIPFGLLLTKLAPATVIITALLANWLVVPIVLVFMHFFLRLMLRFRWFQRFWEWYTAKIQRKLGPLIERWGAWALFIFVAVPGPGSGLYTASVGAYLLKVNLRQFIIVVILGQLAAAALVSAIVLTGAKGFDFFLNLH